MRTPLPLLLLCACAALSALGPGPCRGAPLLGELCGGSARIGGQLPGAQAYVYGCDETVVDPEVASGSLEHLLLEHLLGRYLRRAASSLVEPEGVGRRGAPGPKPYTVQHFRWGTKYGKKRRLMKGSQAAGDQPLADESPEVLDHAQRRSLQAELGTPWDIYSMRRQQQEDEQLRDEEDPEGEEEVDEEQEEMRNFEHAEQKRYGGFMGPGEVCDKKTLLKFLRNVMANER